MAVPELPTDSSASIHLGDYLRVLRARKWVVIGIVLISLAVVAAMSYNAVPQYRATAQLLHGRAGAESLLFGNTYYGIMETQRGMKTDARLIGLHQVAEKVKEELDSSRSPAALASMVSASTDDEIDMMYVSAVSQYPDEAAAVANSFAKQFIVFRAESDQAAITQTMLDLQAQLEKLPLTEREGDVGLMMSEKLQDLRILRSMKRGGYEIAQAASVPGAPFAPRTTRSFMLALAIGLGVGVGLALLLEYSDRRIKSEDVLEREYGVPVLTSVPWLEHSRVRGRRQEDPVRAVGFADQQSPLVESYRILRSGLQFLQLDSRIRSILITSALPQEGKSMTTVNLALSLALSGARVVVLEGDLRRPMIHTYLGLSNDIGISSVLAGTHTFAEASQLVEIDSFAPPEARREVLNESGEHLSLQKNLYVLTAGPRVPNPAEVIGSSRMAELIRKAETMADYVLIDSPPLLIVADGLTLASEVDGVILGARLHQTTTVEARETRALLARSGINVLGLVATGVKSNSGYYSYRRDRYYSDNRSPAPPTPQTTES